ncbi:uncharacterized protein PAC_14625 [Phialocephala subalpina]|uniref:Uncharacterized protein n=1 Tax=Phialocephala subalpina TaxID=576137 RepID=A0A1L7XIE1_9HELO|nr:uncharacterized protein PAC_14625 [Phialocephala subalpina]
MAIDDNNQKKGEKTQHMLEALPPSTILELALQPPSHLTRVAQKQDRNVKREIGVEVLRDLPVFQLPGSITDAEVKTEPGTASRVKEETGVVCQEGGGGALKRTQNLASTARPPTCKGEGETVRKQQQEEEESIAQQAQPPAFNAGPSASSQATSQPESNRSKKKQNRRRRGGRSSGTPPNNMHDRNQQSSGRWTPSSSQHYGFQPSRRVSVSPRRESRSESRHRESSREDERNCEHCADLDNEEYEESERLHRALDCCEMLSILARAKVRARRDVEEVLRRQFRERSPLRGHHESAAPRDRRQRGIFPSRSLQAHQAHADMNRTRERNDRYANDHRKGHSYFSYDEEASERPHTTEEHRRGGTQGHRDGRSGRGGCGWGRDWDAPSR